MIITRLHAETERLLTQLPLHEPELAVLRECIQQYAATHIPFLSKLSPSIETSRHPLWERCVHILIPITEDPAHTHLQSLRAGRSPFIFAQWILTQLASCQVAQATAYKDTDPSSFNVHYSRTNPETELSILFSRQSLEEVGLTPSESSPSAQNLEEITREMDTLVSQGATDYARLLLKILPPEIQTRFGFLASQVVSPSTSTDSSPSSGTDSRSGPLSSPTEIGMQDSLTYYSDSLSN